MAHVWLDTAPKRLGFPCSASEVSLQQVGTSASPAWDLCASTESGGTRRIPLSTVIGVSFNVFHEKMREHVLGQVVIVQRVEKSPLPIRLSWALATLVTCILASFLWLRLGPWSCVAVMSAWCTDLFRSHRRNGWLTSRMFPIAALGALWVLLTWLLPWMLGAERARSSNVYLSTIAVGVMSLLVMWMLQLHWLGDRVLKRSWANALTWTPPPLPKPTFPVVVRFSPEDLPTMFRVRSELWKDPATRALVSDVWVGSYYLEGALSLLPATLYNSWRSRWLIHLSTSYFLPAYTVLQGLGALVPFLYRVSGRLLVMMHADGGVRIAIAVLDINRQVVQGGLSLVQSLCGRAWAWAASALYRSAALGRLAAWVSAALRATLLPLRALLQWAGAASSRALQGVVALARVLNTMVKRYLLPSDYVLVYLRAKLANMEHLRFFRSCDALCSSLLAAYRDALAGAGRLLAALTVPVLEASRQAVALVVAAAQSTGVVALSVAVNARRAAVALVAGARLAWQEGASMAAAAVMGGARRLWELLRVVVFRPLRAPNMAQVGNKVAFEGNRLARYVSMRAGTPRGSGSGSGGGGSSGDGGPLHQRGALSDPAGHRGKSPLNGGSGGGSSRTGGAGAATGPNSRSPPWREPGSQWPPRGALDSVRSSLGSHFSFEAGATGGASAGARVDRAATAYTVVQQGHGLVRGASVGGPAGGGRHRRSLSNPWGFAAEVNNCPHTPGVASSPGRTQAPGEEAVSPGSRREPGDHDGSKATTAVLEERHRFQRSSSAPVSQEFGPPGLRDAFGRPKGGHLGGEPAANASLGCPVCEEAGLPAEAAPDEGQGEEEEEEWGQQQQEEEAEERRPPSMGEVEVGAAFEAGTGPAEAADVPVPAEVEPPVLSVPSTPGRNGREMGTPGEEHLAPRLPPPVSMPSAEGLLLSQGEGARALPPLLRGVKAELSCDGSPTGSGFGSAGGHSRRRGRSGGGGGSGGCNGASGGDGSECSNGHGGGGSGGRYVYLQEEEFTECLNIWRSCENGGGGRGAGSVAAEGPGTGPGSSRPPPEASNGLEWELVLDQPDITLYRRPVEGSKLCEYFARGTMEDVTPNAFRDTYCDIGQRHTWDQYVDSLYYIEKRSKEDFSGLEDDVIYWKCKTLSWPLKCRDYVYARRSQRFQEENVCVVVCRAIEHTGYPETSSAVRVLQYWSNLIVSPVAGRGMDDLGLEFMVLYFDDQRWKHVPAKIINFLAKIALPEGLGRMNEAAASKSQSVS